MEPNHYRAPVKSPQHQPTTGNEVGSGENIEDDADTSDTMQSIYDQNSSRGDDMTTLRQSSMQDPGAVDHAVLGAAQADLSDEISEVDENDHAEDAPLLGSLQSRDETNDLHLNTEVVDVILLQSVLRSSQSGQQTRPWFPISGHWAVEIRGEVFELNRTTTWTSGRLVNATNCMEKFFNNISNFIYYISFFALAGAKSRIDTCLYHDYVNERGEFTIRCSKLGTTSMRQDDIKSQVRKRNMKPMFYSIYSNNCQHFILDLCEHAHLHFNDAIVHALWLKSRLAFLGGCILQSGITISLPFQMTRIMRSAAAIEDKNNLLTIISRMAIYFCALLHVLLMAYIIAPFFYGFQDLAITLDGVKYMHGSCYTGQAMRSALLSTPSQAMLMIYRILMRIETLPYIAFSVFGLCIATCHALLQLYSLSYFFPNLEPLYARLVVFLAEVVEYVLILASISLVMLNQWQRIVVLDRQGRPGLWP